MNIFKIIYCKFNQGNRKRRASDDQSRPSYEPVVFGVMMGIDLLLIADIVMTLICSQAGQDAVWTNTAVTAAVETVVSLIPLLWAILYFRDSQKRIRLWEDFEKYYPQHKTRCNAIYIIFWALPFVLLALCIALLLLA